MNVIKDAKTNIISLKKNTLSLLIISFFVNVFLILAIIYFVNTNIQISESSIFQNLTTMNRMNYFLNNLTNEQRSICLLIFISFFILAILFLYASIRTIWLSNRIEELFEPSKKYNLFVYSIISFIFPFIIFQIILFIKSSNLKKEVILINKKNEEKNIKPVITIVDNTENNLIQNIDDKKINQHQKNNDPNLFDIDSLRKKLSIIKEMLDNDEISYNEYLELKTKAINSI